MSGALTSVGALADAFQEARALAVVSRLADADFAGRRAGSDGAARAAAELATVLRETGLTVTTQRFQLRDVPVFRAAPRMTVDGHELEHRRDYAEHPRSAHRPEPCEALAGDEEEPGTWMILDAVPQGDDLARLAERLAAAGVVGLLVPQFPDGTGFLTKRMLGAPAVRLPIVAVRPDILQTLPGRRITANTPLQRSSATGTNVLAELPGSPGEAPLLLTAHYDGVGDDPGRRFPAAGDNASGVAVLVETARVLAEASRSWPRPIHLALLDGEEIGAQGSRAHARVLRQNGIRPLVLNIDMVGRFNKAISVELGPGSEALRDALDAAGRMLGIPLVPGMVASDNRSYAAAGMAAAGMGSGAAYYHSPLDDPAHIEPIALRQCGRLILVTLAKLMEREIR